jgi:hypothetical protein
MTDFITCNDCQHEFVLDLVERPAAGSPSAGSGGVVEVGHECPMCHTWYRAFYTTPRLKEQAARLLKFRDKAGRSEKDWARYQRKLAEYRRSFAVVNPSRPTIEAAALPPVQEVV